MRRVGIRELRQNLSVHLRDVKRGETLEVTEHGRPVAVLGPLLGHSGIKEQLAISGKIRPATASMSNLGVPPTHLSPSTSLSDSLDDGRSERL